MKFLKYAGLTVVAIIVLFLVVTAFLPREVHVEREITINAAPEVIFAYVNDLQRWTEWSSWHETEPTTKYEYGETTAGEGAMVTWEGEIVGVGTQVITKSVAPELIETALDFKDQGTATAFWKFTPAGDGTDVVWGFDSDMGANPIGKIFGLMMDSMLGPMYKQGLANHKKLCEADDTEGGGSTDAIAENGTHPDAAAEDSSAVVDDATESGGG